MLFFAGETAGYTFFGAETTLFKKGPDLGVFFGFWW